MKKEIKSITIVCDGCGERFVNPDGFVCFTNDSDGSYIENDAESSDWLTQKGKDGVIRHYCPSCYEFDDNDVCHTKDGRRYDTNTGMEI